MNLSGRGPYQSNSKLKCSTTTWTFIKQDGLTEEQFEELLKESDNEIDVWMDGRRLYKIKWQLFISLHLLLFPSTKNLNNINIILFT